MPQTRLGWWSVGFNVFFLTTITTSFALVLIIKTLNFNGHWWNVAVAVSFPASIIALITGIIAVRKYEERSLLVYLSILVGIFTVFFILFHSLFIND